MGQYYRPIILEKDDTTQPVQSWYSHDYGNGLKLMEHSWIDNNFVAEVEHYLLNNPQRLVWEGDYADEELYNSVKNMKVQPKTPIKYEDVWNGTVKTDFDFNELHDTYVVNHDKKEFYKRPEPVKNNGEWNINPLPLLTSEGNGQGGGDYFGEACEEMVGTWARNLIELTKEHPTEDYTEIFPEFKK